MIGNDIVDLAFARRETNWQRPGFIAKVFDDREQGYLQSSAMPEILLWRLWSMKESAYKAHVRITARRFFNPINIQCKLLDRRNATVSIGTMCYKTITTLDARFVYTVAQSDGLRAFESNYFSLSGAEYPTQYRETRKKVYLRMAELLGLPEETISIKKDSAGIPAIYAENSLLSTQLTITHHGKYGAYALSNYDL